MNASTPATSARSRPETIASPSAVITAASDGASRRGGPDPLDFSRRLADALEAAASDRLVPEPGDHKQTDCSRVDGGTGSAINRCCSVTISSRV